MSNTMITANVEPVLRTPLTHEAKGKNTTKTLKSGRDNSGVTRWYVLWLSRTTVIKRHYLCTLRLLTIHNQRVAKENERPFLKNKIME